jgi:two-component system, OmpR family, phosphate regulon sensor histidine kinase PhoR
MLPLAGRGTMSSIARRALALTGIIVAPLVVLAAFDDHRGPVVFFALSWGSLGLAIVWLSWRSIARRVSELTELADTMLDLRGQRPRLRFDDDELGDLARAMSRLTLRLEEVVNGLSTELARREAILASMSEGVLAVNDKLQISFCNDSFAREFATPGAVEGVPLIKVVRDPGLFQLLKQVVESGKTLRQRIKITARDERTFEVHAAPLVGSSSRGALAILHDITPAERLERAKRDFVANISHEFRTPLATITGYAETLLSGGLEDRAHRRKFVEIIQANSVRLNNIAADLITLSELEAGRPEVQPSPIPVSEVIQSAISTLEPVARLNQISLQAREVGEMEVLGYRIRLEQALVNLLDNAIKFNKPSGEVSVRAVENSSDQVEISVSDSGIGIPKEDVNRIFERFYRVDKARSRQVAGTGLGLSIVRHAVEQMKGNVLVESELGKGSCFTIVLPRHRRA